MRVYGEGFLVINAWNNFLCLLLSACLGNQRFKPQKAGLAALFGAVYATFAWMKKGTLLRGLFPLLFLTVCMSFIAFGRAGKRLPILMLLSGWLLSGLSDFAMKRGAGSVGVLLLCGAAAGGICALARREKRNTLKECRLEISLGGRTAVMRGLPDSGNLLMDGLTGIPVIVASEKQLKPVLPPGVKARDLSTLPKGWRLIRAQTAAGDKTLMCFLPDALLFQQGNRAWRAEAEVAVSDFYEARALVPIALFAEQGGKL